MDFLEFRDKLVPASGFQSIQFREIEIRMGITEASKHPVDRKFFTGRLDETDRKYIGVNSNVSPYLGLLRDGLKECLLPSKKNFNFWGSYIKSVNSCLRTKKEIERKANLADLSQDKEMLNMQTLEIHDNISKVLWISLVTRQS